jgi:DNA helicase II / ATP-dependent DNA helicase PcrA
VPITHARTVAQRAEEARLVYVAMTRAVEVLLCSWAAQRTFSGKVIDRRVCPWLADLAAGTAAAAVEAPRPDWRAHLAEQREVLAARRREADPVLEALAGWREEAARAARVSPEAVLDDDLLATVAARRPGDADELAAIAGVGTIFATSRVGESLLTALASLPVEPAANARSA